MATLSATASSIRRSISASLARTSRRLVARMLPGLLAISVAASSRAASINRSAGTIRVTSPIALAAAASTIRPVRKRSRASFSPTCFSRNMDTSAGINPTRTSVYPNLASGAARVKSQSVAIPQPPASAAPFTAAINGFGKLHSRRKNAAVLRASAKFCSGDCVARPFNASRSIPAQKALPAAVMMATRSLPDSTSLSAARISAIIVAEMALRFSGRLSAITASVPSVSIFIVV